jgi:very-short-patch-repair endonuclease
LIDFSNFHFYQNGLVVFPSPYERNRNLGVSSRYIHGGVYKDRRNIPEAMQVVEAVFEHMRITPHESLGVVSLNLTQRDLIQDLFEKRLKITPSVEGFLRTWEEAGSPFFIKNLENVQGDERDVIFISTTFGKSPGATKPYQRFGPISRPEGWRRLNVLFTRSKRRMILFTSLKAEDIVVDESTPQGTRALRDYLEFARRGVLAHVTVTDREPDSDFEISVANVLRQHGFEVVPQLGVANFYLDMAVRNPDRRGEFLAGIECDGATYHNSASARDRDRIRQEILESLGWKGRIWRIWSTDWFTSPRREISRLLSFLETRREASAQEDQFEELPQEDFYQETTEIESTEEAQETDLADMELDADQAEDLYAEVGDSITYVFLDKPEEQNEVHICPGQAMRPDDVGESTPLAKAILGSPTGEICVMNSGDRIRSRSLKILKISRN